MIESSNFSDCVSCVQFRDNSSHHSDHLGSTSVITNITGGLVEETTYDPLGGIVSGGTATNKLYEGKDFDSGTGQYDYGSRFYKPPFFIQPDTRLPNVYDPQQLNRYMFKRGNAYKYIDPSGHEVALPANAFPKANPFGSGYGFNRGMVEIDPFGFSINVDVTEDAQESVEDADLVQRTDLSPEQVKELKDQTTKDFYEKDKDDFWKENGKKAGFNPDKKSAKQDKIKYDEKGRAIGDKNTKWDYDPKSGHFHKYEGEKYGEYKNLDPDGVQRHKGRSILTINNNVGGGKSYTFQIGKFKITINSDRSNSVQTV